MPALPGTAGAVRRAGDAWRRPRRRAATSDDVRAPGGRRARRGAHGLRPCCDRRRHRPPGRRPGPGRAGRRGPSGSARSTSPGEPASSVGRGRALHAGAGQPHRCRRRGAHARVGVAGRVTVVVPSAPAAPSRPPSRSPVPVPRVPTAVPAARGGRPATAVGVDFTPPVPVAHWIGPLLVAGGWLRRVLGQQVRAVGREGGVLAGCAMLMFCTTTPGILRIWSTLLARSDGVIPRRVQSHDPVRLRSGTPPSAYSALYSESGLNRPKASRIAPSVKRAQARADGPACRCNPCQLQDVAEVSAPPHGRRPWRRSARPRMEESLDHREAASRPPSST